MFTNCCEVTQHRTVVKQLFRNGWWTANPALSGSAQSVHFCFLKVGQNKNVRLLPAIQSEIIQLTFWIHEKENPQILIRSTICDRWLERGWGGFQTRVRVCFLHKLAKIQRSVLQHMKETSSGLFSNERGNQWGAEGAWLSLHRNFQVCCSTKSDQ